MSAAPIIAAKAIAPAMALSNVQATAADPATTIASSHPDPHWCPTCQGATIAAVYGAAAAATAVHTIAIAPAVANVPAAAAVIDVPAATAVPATATTTAPITHLLSQGHPTTWAAAQGANK